MLRTRRTHFPKERNFSPARGHQGKNFLCGGGELDGPYRVRATLHPHYFGALMDAGAQRPVVTLAARA